MPEEREEHEPGGWNVPSRITGRGSEPGHKKTAKEANMDNTKKPRDSIEAFWQRYLQQSG